MGLLPKAPHFNLSFSHKLSFYCCSLKLLFLHLEKKRDKGQGEDEALHFEQLFTSCIPTPRFLLYILK